MSEKQIEYLLQVIKLITFAAKATPELLKQYEIGEAKLKQFISEGRDPTNLEWKDLDDKINNLNNRLNNNDEV